MDTDRNAVRGASGSGQKRSGGAHGKVLLAVRNARIVTDAEPVTRIDRNGHLVAEVNALQDHAHIMITVRPLGEHIQS
ncbi:MAG: hypothetical protein Q3977_03525 [Oscillospiraceae bacterium]|nr:hypothetical protein [Oscillospiraceae bacterium]